MNVCCVSCVAHRRMLDNNTYRALWLVQERLLTYMCTLSQPWRVESGCVPDSTYAFTTYFPSILDGELWHWLHKPVCLSCGWQRYYDWTQCAFTTAMWLKCEFCIWISIGYVIFLFTQIEVEQVPLYQYIYRIFWCRTFDIHEMTAWSQT